MEVIVESDKCDGVAHHDVNEEKDYRKKGPDVEKADKHLCARLIFHVGIGG